MGGQTRGLLRPRSLVHDRIANVSTSAGMPGKALRPAQVRMVNDISALAAGGAAATAGRPDMGTAASESTMTAMLREAAGTVRSLTCSMASALISRTVCRPTLLRPRRSDRGDSHVSFPRVVVLTW